MKQGRVIPLRDTENAFAELEPRTELLEKYGVIAKLTRTYKSQTRSNVITYFDWFDYMNGGKSVMVRRIHPESGKYEYRRLKIKVQLGTLQIIRKEAAKEYGRKAKKAATRKR